jgi:hypothetical protein
VNRDRQPVRRIRRAAPGRTGLLDDPRCLTSNVACAKLIESFLQGLAAQRTQLERPRGVLLGPTTWLLHPSVLSYLSRIPQMTPPEAGASGERAHHQALRTLARLFFVLSTIDGELSRIAGSFRRQTVFAPAKGGGYSTAGRTAPDLRGEHHQKNALPGAMPLSPRPLPRARTIWLAKHA